eukprot:CAMPEP_0183291256 /NCGR_PEP_ID=MMETSP0160_2-20130417/736_1 /TAXON_ID=2839 ORGANISM="Odontella Sinensis, Strain Grunow 1884" /NCGR_SAMPLE_ID=MMETSP0160_2 /ASSEMBLY_ACC=CAM_ASM_000250 /LENGTH=260 /DNA_ID=CAMNT_0025452039 /DNA_START=51 /DNA_END=833 /DNA_ORIENTATION=+
MAILGQAVTTAVLLLVINCVSSLSVHSIATYGNHRARAHKISPSSDVSLSMAFGQTGEEAPSRRTFLTSAAAVTATSFISLMPKVAIADDKSTPRPSVEKCLYYILRVQEATEQETRLIKSGKFKDVQRANVKLAIRFMITNYNLSDNFIAAAGTLEGNRRIKAGEAGQAVVQNLYTILEYFDSSDVDNLKVGTSNSMAGKEGIVLSGLDTAKKGIDEYLSYFPENVVNSVRAQIQEENELNRKEFDSSLGNILNLAPKT